MKTKDLLWPLLLLFALGSLSGAGNTSFGSFGSKNGSHPIYIPRRTKFKGWMRENRKYTFNKNK